MSNTKKILTIVFSVLLIVVFGFAVTWCVINFNQVKTGMASTGVYTIDDINNAYEDGYGTALTDKEEYEELINGYRDTIIALNDTISQLNSQVNDLSSSNRDYTTQVESLTEQKEILDKQVETLSNDKINNEATIQSLNTVIYNLNKQISDMSRLSQNYTSQINELNNHINELQASVSYYESYIATLENSKQVVATFEYDGSVYNIQVINKGAQLSVVAPESTETKIFNGWKVDDNLVDLNEYRIVQNTKFVADITYKFSVQFIVDSEIQDSQLVIKDDTATLPQAPVKDGYEFLGWSLNGVDIIENIETLPVTENTTYHAVFIKIHTVTFIAENQVIATQYIRNGNYANSNEVQVETDGTFMGWQVNDLTVNVDTYQVFTDTIFVAEIKRVTLKFIVDRSSIRDKYSTAGEEGEDLILEITLGYGSYVSQATVNLLAEKVQALLNSYSSTSSLSGWYIPGYSYVKDDMIMTRIDFNDYQILKDTVFHASIGCSIYDLPEKPLDLSLY